MPLSLGSRLPGPKLHVPPPPRCVGVPNADKKDCGFSGSTEADCLERRCCWDPISPDPDHYPCCFNITPVPPPPRPPRPPSARPILKLTIEAANERWFDAVQWLRHHFCSGSPPLAPASAPTIVPQLVICIAPLDVSSLTGALPAVLCRNWGFRPCR